MSYATVEEFLAALPREEAIELSDLDENREYPVPMRIQNALDRAFEEINTYRFQQGDAPPYNDKPPRLRDIEIIIARKNLNAYSWQEGDPRYRDYKDAIGWLEKWVKGAVRLPVLNHQNATTSVDSQVADINAWSNNVLWQIGGSPEWWSKY